MLGAISDQTLLYLMYAAVALGALALVTGVGQLISRQETRAEAKSRRMLMVAQGRSTEERLALLRPPERFGLFHRLPLISGLNRTLRKAGYVISPRLFLFYCASAVAGTLLVAVNFVPVELAALIALTAGLGLPLAVVTGRARQRTDALVRQLPDALDLMARGLRVGHPLNTSIGAVAEEMPDPVGTQFGIIFDQVTFGDDLVDAFREFAERADVEDVNYLAASIGIQHGTGGDLVRVITVLARTIRARISMRKRIHAISSEGRLSAWFLSLLPLAIFGFTMVATPSYYGAVMEDPLFRPMAITVIGLVIVNALVLRHLVRFRI